MPLENQDQDDRNLYHSLDREYKQSLKVLKKYILLLRESSEIHICIQWITRLNQSSQGEKCHRNNLLKLLIDQLAECNLNYPFTYPKNLEMSLRSIDMEVQQLSQAECSSEPNNTGECSELNDIFANLKLLLSDAETMNLKVEEDLQSIRSEALSVNSEKNLEYNLWLGTELKHLLSEEIPRLVEAPHRKVSVQCNDRLREEDCDWMNESIERIRQSVLNKFPVVQEKASKAVQTRRKGKMDDKIEQIFCRFYTDCMLKDRAQMIQAKVKEGVSRIEQSRVFEHMCLDKNRLAM
ncbi:uncharacterized protein LOC134212609 [Armigeres subalbatus]|uniref:uncharacterized protein LOC134212609 n=1 Tax=Armigeres subalbatus TaxID=124917 RepID=UPI002ECFBEFE